MKLPLGRVLIAQKAMATLREEEIVAALQRHETGDWGDVSFGDKDLNDRALVDDERVLSAYHNSDGTKYWIITEWDRSVTTVLLPDEY